MKIGCFTLPFRAFPLEQALEAIAASGFRHVGIWPTHAEKPLFEPKAGEDGKVAAVRRAIEAADLKPTVLFGQHQPLDEAQWEAFAIKLEQAAALGCSELLAWGPWPWKEFHVAWLPEPEWKRLVDAFFTYLPRVAKQAEAAGVTVAYKPHCGVTAAAMELKLLVERAGSPRIRASYDGGNVSFYEGLNPAEDIKLVAPLCHSLIVKDHKGGKGGREFPNVGLGEVDHKAMLAVLKAHGFAGPVSVEKLEGKTLEELAASAKHSCAVLERYAAELG
ncbi:MAG: sugar phosphate isomerase/epimerase [Planctomycetota bacterium]|nr:sugar phosphate isomerase/epimerase [Planctomycetota bacterium]